jgi:endonuclease YncB( thermonuclease family)
MTFSDIRPFVAKLNSEVYVYDGDTVTVKGAMDIGWGCSINKPKLRLIGIDTPEKGWRAQTDRERQLALIARDFLKDMITSANEVLVYSEDGRGKYGRWLVHIVCDGVDCSEALIHADLARPYFGGTKDTTPW